MSESDNKMTWSAPPGVPVYGAMPGAPPPDYEQPWEFNAIRTPQQPVAAPAPPPAAVSAQAPLQAPVPQPLTPAPAPEIWLPAPAAPAPPPPPPQYHRPLPDPLGPALTPDERYYQIYGRPLPPP